METVAVVFILLFGLVGAMAASVRGWHPAMGFLAGALLGPFALLLFFVSGVTRKASAPMKVCSQCAEQVQPAAKVCRFCGNKFDW